MNEATTIDIPQIDAVAPAQVESSARDDETSVGVSLDNLDLDSVLKWVQRHIYFLVVLLVYFLVSHLEGIVVFIWGTLLIYHGNNLVLKRLSEETEETGNSPIISWASSSLLSCVVLILLYYNPIKGSLLFQTRSIIPFWDLLFQIAISDIFLRLSAISIKISVILLSQRYLNNSRRNNLCSLVEYTFFVYRYLIPIPYWFYLILHQNQIFNCILVSLYLTLKILNIIKMSAKLMCSIKAFHYNELGFNGNYATVDQVKALSKEDSICVVCQEELKTPIILFCNHIFCEQCILKWFNTQKNCPICRTDMPHTSISQFSYNTNLFFQIL